MLIIIKSIVIVILSILLLNIQVRIVNRIFPQKEVKRKILWYTLLMGLLVASSLLAFTYIVQPYISTLFKTDSITYSIYIAAVWWIIAILFATKRQRRRTFIISTLTVLALISWVAEIVFAWAWIWLIILKATWEEVLKTASSQSLSSHDTFYKSDIIIFSILAWLWFALFENIVYFIAAWSIGQFIARSITISLLHWIFTGTIWYILWRYAKNSFLSYTVAYALWILLHSFYNISLTYSPVIWWIVFTIWWYFLLSYLLYKSDRLYNNK